MLSITPIIHFFFVLFFFLSPAESFIYPVVCWCKLSNISAVETLSNQVTFSEKSRLCGVLEMLNFNL